MSLPATTGGDEPGHQRVALPCALIVIDVQRGFDDPAWGRPNNPAFEANVARLIAEFRRRALPLVYVRHESRQIDSPLAPGTAGNHFAKEVTGEPDLLVTKHVHSAFYGKPDLDRWLQDRGVESVAICGIATDHCCETTARMAGDLGYPTFFVLDATRTFDRTGPDGGVVAADEVARVTAASLHGEFATVLETRDLVAGLG